MKRKFQNVYQFKIVLKGIKPPIWRRIQVPENFTFWDLHVAIQDVMGWFDYHLHEFVIRHPITREKVYIINPYEDEGFFERKYFSEFRQKIADWFSMENKIARYTYDFGDNWDHEIKLEKILPRDRDIIYPICVGGKRACPPEDCGGIWGYKRFLEIIGDPEHEEYEEMLEWVGGEFDPEYFDAKEVEFRDSDKERREIYGR
ncbi:plasmid pRiA4b ORF-3 family protein [Deferribacter autotrophicus]|uniref:Plasmid pRiA4b ORF-3 family protein n=1 Tax=Deferribacter autotrophicus TaxID=500465 RepID=A0A5A8F7Q3_9BACT|nr:plasmid pRiA4b ORF-3 family protein [Deferribacter autotrophicus]KAA0259108.1 plasmid pRiA4b ORF-3 family protein [Deferribacter autotrophicus]